VCAHSARVAFHDDLLPHPAAPHCAFSSPSGADEGPSSPANTSLHHPVLIRPFSYSDLPLGRTREKETEREQKTHRVHLLPFPPGFISGQLLSPPFPLR
jgi:hypothetical protein